MVTAPDELLCLPRCSCVTQVITVAKGWKRGHVKSLMGNGNKDIQMARLELVIPKAFNGGPKVTSSDFRSRILALCIKQCPSLPSSLNPSKDARRYRSEDIAACKKLPWQDRVLTGVTIRAILSPYLHLKGFDCREMV
jgi:hypothetical protein